MAAALETLKDFNSTTHGKIITGTATAAALIALYLAKPPRAFQDRLKTLSESETCINNDIYNQSQWLSSWWGTKDSHLALLQKLNPVRIPYFDRIWRQILGDSVIGDAKKKFLDAGCGGGIATEALAQLGYQMVGMDVSEGSIDVARKHAEQSLIQNVEYKTGSIYQIPFDDSTFEGVISSDVFEHLHDLNQAVAEIKRVLKPGGVFVFDTINRTWWSWIMTVLIPQHILGILPHDVHDWRMFITPSEMKQLLESHGFEVPEIKQEFRGMSQVFNPFTMLRKLSLAGGVSFAETKDLSASFLGWARKPK